MRSGTSICLLIVVLLAGCAAPPPGIPAQPASEAPAPAGGEPSARTLVVATDPQVEGFVVRELARHPSNYRSHQSLDDYLKEHGIPGIEGIDTRALVRRLRVRGAMNAVLSTTDPDDASLVHKARTAPHMVGRDLVKESPAGRSLPGRPQGSRAASSRSRRFDATSGPGRARDRETGRRAGSGRGSDLARQSRQVTTTRGLNGWLGSRQALTLVSEP